MGMLDVKVDGGLFSGIGDAVSGIINAVKGQIPPEKAAELELKALEIRNQLVLAQVAVNQAEAASPSVFVSGWRPAIGWICGGALFMHYLARPLLEWASAYYGWGIPPLPSLDDTLQELVFGMLGLGGLRTFEKVRGAARAR